MPRTAYALVDYFNVAALPRNRPPTFKDHSEAVDGVVSLLLRQCRVLQPRPESLRIRLYGGWHDERTHDYSEARQALGAIARRYYPTGGRPSRVFLHLADALMSLPGHDLSHTLRLWSGLPPLRVERPDNCGYPSKCPLDHLRHWQRNRCPMRPGCTVRSRAAIGTERQKLVDTAIVADTIHFARHYESDWIAVVSNDDDILPGLISGAADHGRLLLITIDRTNPSSYADLLSQVSVDYFALDRRS
ncbi:MAG: hypothetical protein J4F98_10640 [Acidobacteria bacterium]|nr:hypothetical protein [Acidobacteriota bacterium]